MTAAKKAQATAEVKVAAAEAGSSAAKIPVVGWVTAIAAIAAVFAAMMSAPSFSTGGILTGNSFVGDNMIAKVNSGEMILNSRQQRNLFNLLDGNTGNSFSNGKVEFKIAGKELIGVLNNYSSKTNKYK